MFEFGLLNNKEERRIFFIMKHLFIEHKYPINKNFCLKLLTITLTVSKNQGCQEKIEVKYNKNQDCLDKKF